VAGNADADAKLAGLIEKVTKIASGDLDRKVIKALSEAAVSEVKKGFRESRDPYGTPWRALKYRKGRPLLDKGRMRNSFAAQISELSFRVGTNDKRAPWHQFGTGGRKQASTRIQATRGGRFIRRSQAKAKGKKGNKETGEGGVTYTSVGIRALNFKAGGGKIPARPMVPTAAFGLGPYWTRAFQRAGVAVLRAYLKKK
jgi:phage gpG-like protein